MAGSNTLVAGVQQQPKFSAAISTSTYQRLINNTLRDPNRAKRFIASVTSAVAVNPPLQECEVGSILAGAFLGESLNLSPSPQLGQYYLVPFECKLKGPNGKTIWLFDGNGNHIIDAKGKWVAASEKRAQFVLGYKGYIQLALRSGQYVDLDVMDIKEGEYRGKDPTTGKPRFQFIEDDDKRDELPVIGYMAYFEYRNGFRKTLYWSRQKMMRHADTYSPAFSMLAYQQIQNGEIPNSEMWRYSSFWYKNFDEMAKKTLLRQLISRWGIMSTEMQTAFEQDNSMVSSDGEGGFITEPEPVPDSDSILPNAPEPASLLEQSAVGEEVQAEMATTDEPPEEVDFEDL